MESSTFALDCVLPYNEAVPRSVMRQVLVVCFPLLVFLTIAHCWILRSRRKDKVILFVLKHVALTLAVVLYVSYIVLVRVAVNGFNCIDVDDGTDLEDVGATHSYWALDTSVRCFEGSHEALVWGLCIPLLVLSLMLPLCLAVGLLCARRSNMLDSAVIQETVGLFFRGFEERWVFWDAVILLRKALLAIIVVFAYSLGGNLQGLLAGSLLAVALSLQLELRPFKKSLRHLNLMESLSLFVSCFTFLGGVILNDPMMTSSVVEILLVVVIFIGNVMLVMILLRLLIEAKLEHIGYRLLRNRIECDVENPLQVMLILGGMCAHRIRRILGHLGLTKKREERDVSRASLEDGGTEMTNLDAMDGCSP